MGAGTTHRWTAALEKRLSGALRQSLSAGIIRPVEDLQTLVSRLTARDSARAEANVQADVRSLLLAAPFDLAEDELRDVVLESPVGDRRRIDVETGTTVIEIKRDLRKSGVIDEALQQLQGYVAAREREVGCRYVGILTDGTEWRCFHLQEERLTEVARHAVRKDQDEVDKLLVWLEGVLATAQGIPPTPEEIATRLGAGSSSHALDRASLAALYARHRENPSLRMRRTLWARLLTTALGSQFEDSDDLFVEHTLLVNSAEILAHAVLGLPIQTLPPGSLLTGGKFTERGIHGVVEPDFFDWVPEVPGGEMFIRTLAKRLARFDWHRVEHDVLKVLYESVIAAETRKKLGEYYTPDWLAEKQVHPNLLTTIGFAVFLSSSSASSSLSAGSGSSMSSHRTGSRRPTTWFREQSKRRIPSMPLIPGRPRSIRTTCGTSPRASAAIASSSTCEAALISASMVGRSRCRASSSTVVIR